MTPPMPRQRLVSGREGYKVEEVEGDPFSLIPFHFAHTLFHRMRL